MCVKVAVDPPAPMVNTPPGLQQAILRCLAKSPEQRYANMAEFARDLIPFAQDEHQAHMLVERMQRMLSRSTFNWEASGMGTGTSRVHPVRDPASAPIRALTPPPQWGAGSDPAASPWAGKSEPNAQPWQQPGRGSSPLLRKDGSAPFVRQELHETTGPAVTVNVRPKRRWPLVLGAIALLSIGGAVAAVAVNSGSDEAKPTAAPTVQMTTDEPKQPTVEVKQAEVVKEPEVVQQPEVVKEPLVVKQPEAKQPIKRPSGTKIIRQPSLKTTTKVDEPTQPETKPATKPCDPFTAMHGCPDKK
jgi:hypothetical protein